MPLTKVNPTPDQTRFGGFFIASLRPLQGFFAVPLKIF